MIEKSLEQDLKSALLSRDAVTVSTLRGLKSTILYAKVAAKLPREDPLPDSEVIQLLSKEAKKRQESADLYIQGGNQDRADAELLEKKIIEKYLPAQLSEKELSELIDRIIAEISSSDTPAMGQIIGKVKQASAGAADGAVIARLVKERLS